MEWEFNSYYTLIAATLVLLVGKFLVQKIKFLRDFNIPGAGRWRFGCRDYPVCAARGVRRELQI
ncbi:glutamate permease [Neisseria meningitidis]|nr:glutamate permease [Neisseria meningitidis]